MIKFIKRLFKTKPEPKKMGFAEEYEKEYIYMGDGMIEEVISRSKANPAQAALSTIRNQNPNRTGTAPIATHYDRSYTDNAHMGMITPATIIHSTPSYTSSSSGYDPGYSSCDSGSSGGSCD